MTLGRIIATRLGRPSFVQCSRRVVTADRQPPGGNGHPICAPIFASRRSFARVVSVAETTDVNEEQKSDKVMEQLRFLGYHEQEMMDMTPLEAGLIVKNNVLPKDKKNQLPALIDQYNKVVQALATNQDPGRVETVQRNIEDHEVAVAAEASSAPKNMDVSPFSMESALPCKDYATVTDAKPVDMESLTAGDLYYEVIRREKAGMGLENVLDAYGSAAEAKRTLNLVLQEATKDSQYEYRVQKRRK